MVACERGTRPPEPSLNLIHDQQDVVLCGQCADGGKVAGWRDDDACLALNWLEQHGDGVVVNECLKTVDITKGNRAESGRERPEAGTRIRICREPHDRGRSSVEVVVSDDDRALVLGDAFALVTPASRCLDGRLDCLGTRIHGKDCILASEAGEVCAELRESIVVECTARQGHPLRLGTESIHQSRVTMTEVQCGVAGECVEVLDAMDIGQPDVFGLRNDDRQRCIVMSRMLFK